MGVAWPTRQGGVGRWDVSDSASPLVPTYVAYLFYRRLSLLCCRSATNESVDGRSRRHARARCRRRDFVGAVAGDTPAFPAVGGIAGYRRCGDGWAAIQRSKPIGVIAV